MTGWHNAHPATYWAAQGYDWSKEDEISTEQFNHVRWRGLIPGRPYPGVRNGLDYSKMAPVTKAAFVTIATQNKAD